MPIPKIVRHLPFLRRRPLRRTKRSGHSRRPPDRIPAPHIAPIARRRPDSRLPGPVGPDIAAVRPGIIMKLDIRAEIRLDRRALPGILVVVDADDRITALRPA